MRVSFSRQPNAAFLSGYLALLFAEMSGGQKQVSDALLDKMPGSVKSDKISILVDSVTEFRTTYERFQLHLTQGLKRDLQAGDDVEVVVDDTNSAKIIEHALDVYKSL